MRDKQRKRTAILVTDDPAVEAAARDVADEMGDLLQLIKADDDATSAAFDASAVDSFAIVDIDTRFGTRSMFNTIAGLLPVIAVTRKRKPWLQSTLRRHRSGVSLIKPISREDLRMAFSERKTSVSTMAPDQGSDATLYAANSRIVMISDSLAKPRADDVRDQAPRGKKY